jgi:hypothetical protein
MNLQAFFNIMDQVTPLSELSYFNKNDNKHYKEILLLKKDHAKINELTAGPNHHYRWNGAVVDDETEICLFWVSFKSVAN